MPRLAVILNIKSSLLFFPDLTLFAYVPKQKGHAGILFSLISKSKGSTVALFASVICSGKSITKMRIPGNWAPLIDNGRLLLLSPFIPRQKHITGERAQYRNLFVAALAKEIYIFYAADGSKTMTLFRQVLAWGKPVRTFHHPVNEHLIDAGALMRRSEEEKKKRSSIQNEQY